MLEHGVELAAHPLQRRGVETRRVHCQRQEFEGLVDMTRQGLQPPVEIVALGAEAQAYRMIVEGAMKRLGVEIARAFVEQAGEHGAGAGLALGILRGAAGKGKLHRDQRHGVILHQPGGDAAGADDVLHALGARGDFGGSVHFIVFREQLPEKLQTFRARICV